MERQTTEGGQGAVPDLSALLGSLGQEGGPDLSSLLSMIKGSGPEDPEGVSGGGSDGGGTGGGIDFASLLGMLGGLGGPGGGEEKPPPPPEKGGAGEGSPTLDPALFVTFHRAMKAMREPDRNITLLQALRPFLEPERQKMVDEAIKFLHLMKLAPLLQGLSPDGGQ